MKTGSKFLSWVLSVVIFGGVCLWLSPIFAQQPQVSDMLQKYGQTSAPRDFEGTLYCLRCNFSPTPENLATCDKEGHAHFLLMEDGHMHPLYGINKAIADKINSKELHEKQVKIRGTFYPVANAILVGDVQPARQ
jgi:hypothetical protein